MKGGLGSASMTLAGGFLVGAIVAVNALGDIIDQQTQQVIAGAQHAYAPPDQSPDTIQPEQLYQNNPFGNTTIAVVATNAALTKAEANKIAQMAHDGLARVIRPAHTMFDGDTIFTLSTGIQSVRRDPATTAQHISAIGAAAADTLARAIIKAVRTAQDLHGIPAARL